MFLNIYLYSILSAFRKQTTGFLTRQGKYFPESLKPESVLDQFDFPGFGLAGIPLDSHHIEPAVTAFDPVLGHEPPCHLTYFPLLVRRDRFQWLPIFRIGPGLHLHEHQHFILLRDDIDLSGFVAVVFLDDPVSLLLRYLTAAFSPSLPKCNRSCVTDPLLDCTTVCRLLCSEP